MNAALGNLLARVAQGDLSPHEAKTLAAGQWIQGINLGDDLTAFAVELKKLRDEMQTDRYAASVASRPVEEIEKILKSPHLDALQKNRIKVFSFGKRFGRVTARMVYNAREDVLKKGRELHESMARAFLPRMRIHTDAEGMKVSFGPPPPFKFAALDFDRYVPAVGLSTVSFDRLTQAAQLSLDGFARFHELGLKGKKPARARKGKRAKPAAARRKRSRATRRAKAADPTSR